MYTITENMLLIVRTSKVFFGSNQTFTNIKSDGDSL